MVYARPDWLLFALLATVVGSFVVGTACFIVAFSIPSRSGQAKAPLRYSLRTLMIGLVLGPMALALAWFIWCAYRNGEFHQHEFYEIIEPPGKS